jgi:hypothetical protein
MTEATMIGVVAIWSCAVGFGMEDVVSRPIVWKSASFVPRGTNSALDQMNDLAV